MEYSLGGAAQRKGEIYGSQVRTVLTEVVNDTNIQYLNTDDDDDPGCQLYITQVWEKWKINLKTFIPYNYRHLLLELAWQCLCWTPSCPLHSTIIKLWPWSSPSSLEAWHLTWRWFWQREQASSQDTLATKCWTSATDVVFVKFQFQVSSLNSIKESWTY